MLKTVENGWWSRRCRRIRSRSQGWSWTAAHPPATEEYEEVDNGSTDHGPWSGEGPVVDRDFFSLLGHGLEFVEQDFGIKLAGDFGAKLVDGCGVHLTFWLLEQLSQGPGPVKPHGVDLDLLAVTGHDDVVHGPDITAQIDPDSLAWGDLYSRNRLHLWTDMIGVDLPEGIHHIRIAVQMEDLFLCLGRLSHWFFHSFEFFFCFLGGVLYVLFDFLSKMQGSVVNFFLMLV